MATTTEARKMARDAAELSGHALAEKLRCQFAGDADYIDHGGYFFNTQNWKQYGYAECVEFEQYGNVKRVAYGTINRPDDLTSALKYIGMTTEALSDMPPERRVLVEIEACKACQGAETAEDFSGRYERTFPADVADHRILAYALEWLRELAGTL